MAYHHGVCISEAFVVVKPECDTFQTGHQLQTTLLQT